jgi:hypothetical protein
MDVEQTEKKDGLLESRRYSNALFTGIIPAIQKSFYRFSSTCLIGRNP